MIITYIKLVAAVIMPAQPVVHDVNRGPRLEPAQIHHATAPRAEESKAAPSARAANGRQSAPTRGCRSELKEAFTW